MGRFWVILVFSIIYFVVSRQIMATVPCFSNLTSHALLSKEWEPFRRENEAHKLVLL
jgi:hypothetical protein